MDNYKIIAISAKRQITIPQKFFSRFCFGSRAKVSAMDNGILIQPAEDVLDGEFDVQILQDLVQRGLSGQELAIAFEECKAGVKPAVRAMLLEAHKIAHDEAEYDTLDDVFGE